jgi:hypothetical protein
MLLERIKTRMLDSRRNTESGTEAILLNLRVSV